MQVGAFQHQVKAADLAPEKLAANAVVSEQDKLSEASRQFEAVLLRQVLGDAQKPMFTSTIVKDSAAGSIYRDLITNQLADSISRSGSFGLAKTLEPQLQHQLAARKPVAEAGGKASATPPGELLRPFPRASINLSNRFTAPPTVPATETPAHGGLLMLQLSRQAKPLKAHE